MDYLMEDNISTIPSWISQELFKQILPFHIYRQILKGFDSGLLTGMIVIGL